MADGQPPGDLEELGQAVGQTGGEFVATELGPSGQFVAGQVGHEVGGAVGAAADAVVGTFQHMGPEDLPSTPDPHDAGAPPAATPVADPGAGVSVAGTDGSGGMS